ncbi:MAG: hypothetical protein MUE46_13130, partial [Xanthomonadales bacterium]|nr:hypothetical protein [Xanthomonadales bacterium]
MGWAPLWATWRPSNKRCSRCAPAQYSGVTAVYALSRGCWQQIGSHPGVMTMPGGFRRPLWHTARMDKHFNTAGPSTPDLHYLLDPLQRIDFDSIADLIEQRRYFVLHAPRQTGKTTCLLALRDRLNQDGQFAALYVNVEPAQALRGNVAAAMEVISNGVARQLMLTLGFDLAAIAQTLDSVPAGAKVQTLLQLASEGIAKPLLVFFDEVDALVGDTLISLLRQIRAGYTERPQHFPQSIMLCGVRDVRDYRMTMADGEVITGGSAFNIKAESLRLGDF